MPACPDSAWRARTRQCLSFRRCLCRSCSAKASRSGRQGHASARPTRARFAAGSTYCARQMHQRCAHPRKRGARGARLLQHGAGVSRRRAVALPALHAAAEGKDGALSSAARCTRASCARGARLPGASSAAAVPPPPATAHSSAQHSSAARMAGERGQGMRADVAPDCAKMCVELHERPTCMISCASSVLLSGAGSSRARLLLRVRRVLDAQHRRMRRRCHRGPSRGRPRLVRLARLRPQRL